MGHQRDNSEEHCVQLSSYMAQCTGIGVVLSFGKVVLQSVLTLALAQRMFQGSEDLFSLLQNFPNGWSTPEQPGPLTVLPNINALAQAYPNLFGFDLQHAYTSQVLRPIRFQPHMHLEVSSYTSKVPPPLLGPS